MSPRFLLPALLGLGLSVGLTLSSASSASAPSGVERFLGVWLTEDKDGAVAIYRCGKALCGKLHWIKPSDEPDAAIDDKNPDPKLRGRPLCGMEFMGGFTPQKDGSISSGWIYSPRHGSTFSAALAPGQAPDTIELRGYFILPLLGESQTWTKAASVEACQPPKQP